MSEGKQIKARMQQKYDTAENWKKAGDNGFIPLAGELIIYSGVDNDNNSAIKIGNGKTNVNQLPYASAGSDSPGDPVETLKPLSTEDIMDELTTPGKYYCETEDIAKEIENCPITEPFTLDVRYSNGVGPYVNQELRPLGKGARMYRQFVNYQEILNDESKELYNRFPQKQTLLGGYDGSVDTTWYYNNSSNSVLYISTEADLYGLAYLVNEEGLTFAGKTIKLTNDLIVNDTYQDDNLLDWSTSPPDYSWKPIGAAYDSVNTWQFRNWFEGTIDGQGHYISGLYNKQGRDNAFICYAVNATIKNLAIINSYFENTGIEASAKKPDDSQILGTFVGRGYGVVLNNLYSDAILVSTGTDYHTGGIAGFTKSNGSQADKNSPAITHYYWESSVDSVVFDGSIITKTQDNGGKAGSLVGGIIGGTDNSYVTIKNSLFTGSIETNDTYVGGIIGRISQNSVIDSCVSVGTIISTNDFGSIVGQLFATGNQPAYEPCKFTIINSYYSTGTKLYALIDNSSSISVEVNATNSKELSAECLEHSMVPTRWISLYDSENNSMNLNGVMVEVIWENANQRSDFGGQLIPLNLSPYEFIAVIDGSGSVYTIPRVQDNRGSIKDVSVQVDDPAIQGGKIFSRDFYINSSGITFNEGKQYNIYTGYGTYNNSCAIPVYILGIKGVLK